MTVKIIGLGWVGRAVQSIFPDALVHDPLIGRHALEKTDVAFVCVPTPNLRTGALDMRMVEEVVKECDSPLIVIRSTLQPGTADALAEKYNKNICVQPEYLGETTAHPLFEEGDRKFLIIGGAPEDRRKLVELYQTVYNANIKIRQVTNYEAEVIKLSENRAIAFKVAQCQELYDACEKNGVDYYTIRDAVYGDDPRFDLWFSFVYPDNRGMNSKCIPKDVYAWRAWAESADPAITKALLEKNKKWLNMI